MLISVILTTFKRPTLLIRAAQSVIRQSLPENVKLELIISDDDPYGSAISKLEELKNEAATNITIQYIKRSGDLGGVARSRNRALAASSGQWILFLDDDDLLLEGALAKLLQTARENDADFCAGAYEKVLEDSEGQVKDRELIVPAWSFESLLIGNPFPIGCFVARRESIVTPFNPLLQTHEDWLFLLDNIREDSRIEVVTTAVMEVRLSTNPSRQHRNETGDKFQKAADYARIYALHPCKKSFKKRKLVLQSLGGCSLDTILGEHIEASALQYHETRQGRFLICNPLETIQYSLLHHGEFEIIASRIAEAVIPLKSGAVIDVGANIGAFTVPVARSFPGRKVISVEPQRMVFMHLCANVLGNRLTNVEPMNFALGSDISNNTLQVPFFDIFSERYTGSVSLNPEVQRTRRMMDGVAEPSSWANQYETIEIKSLDNVAQELEISFIKIDVEGMEEAVLRSGEFLLSTQRPFLFFEAWALPQFQFQTASLLQFVMEKGYTVLQVGNDCFAYHPKESGAISVISALAEIGLQIVEQKS
jgi:FkbM family methyltransferase